MPLLRRALGSARHHARIYRHFVATSLAQAMGFRAHFCLLVLMDAAFYAASLYSVSLLFDHVGGLGGWDRPRMMFFLAFALLVHQIHMAFVSDNFWRFPEMLLNGEMDFAILRPGSALFSVFFRVSRPGNMVCMVAGAAALAHFGAALGLEPWKWALVPLGVALGVALNASLEILLCCSMFWMLEGTGVNFLRLELQRLGRWPDFIYGRALRLALTFAFPLLLVANAPVRFLLDPADWGPLAAMAAALPLVWALTALAWGRGLRRYESASS